VQATERPDETVPAHTNDEIKGSMLLSRCIIMHETCKSKLKDEDVEAASAV